MLRAKWHCGCSETKNKFPKHYEYFFSLFFTSCLNSTVSLPSSSFVLTKDILTQVRKPPENFQLEYELSQSFMNFAFSGLKGKKKSIILLTKLSTVRRTMSDSQALQTMFTIPFILHLLNSTYLKHCVVMFS